MRGRADADSEQAAAALAAATGVFFSGGDQSRLRTLVGSRSADVLRQRLAGGLVVAGTSAGATALGHVMILGGNGADVSAAAVRTGPGLGLVPKSLIDMHFGERGRLPRLLSAVALDPDQLGIGIDENTGILVEGSLFEVLGSGVVTVVDAEDATVVHAATECGPHHTVRRAAAPAARRLPVRLRHPDPGHRARARPVLTRTRETRSRCHVGAPAPCSSGPNVFTGQPGERRPAGARRADRPGDHRLPRPGRGG